MKPGDQVIHLNAPWTMGLGTITGINEIGWLEIDWANSDVGAYPPQHVELASVWERQQVEQATSSPPLSA